MKAKYHKKVAIVDQYTASPKLMETRRITAIDTSRYEHYSDDIKLHLRTNDLPVSRSNHFDDRIYISGNGVEIELPMNVLPELMTAILQGIRSC